ncbi:VOC family protein [Amycolatopsis sp. NPDC004079]|uniref:VOC family protein n=1 Tax=Amycolatopsis sp. NPDC004079 TaxID=3154549 RepID=UPI0033BAF747
MTDVLDSLRAPIVPIDPDPEFAADLRARLEQALLRIGSPEPEPSGPGEGEDVAPGTLTAYLSVDGAREALEWYAEVFGARRRGAPMEMPDGRVGHAELILGDSVLMLADEAPEHGVLGPKKVGGVSQTLMLAVSDVDATVARALAGGATLSRPVTEYPYGRSGVILDPFGHRWLISTRPENTRAAKERRT